MYISNKQSNISDFIQDHLRFLVWYVDDDVHYNNNI